MSEVRRAMIFAAGLGTRLRPLTTHTPKALVQVAGKPLLEHVLERFEAAGCERIVINTHHLGEQIAAHVSARASRAALYLSPEDPLLETGGGLVKALPLLGDQPFFSANSDTFWLDEGTPALARMRATWDPERMDALLLLQPVARAVGYSGSGDFDLDPAGRVRRSSAPPYVFTGLQILHPRLFHGRRAEPFSLRELYRAAEDGHGVLSRMHGLVHAGSWVHVGSPAELAEVERFFGER